MVYHPATHAYPRVCKIPPGCRFDTPFMITLADTLDARHISLGPAVEDRAQAILRIVGLLRNDPRGTDWESLYAQLSRATPCRCEDEASFAICLPHARTDAVTEMVMSVGRFHPLLDFAESAKPVRYLFVIAAPVAMAADYLRIVGLLMRVIRNPVSEQALNDASTSEAFLDVLTGFEVSL